VCRLGGDDDDDDEDENDDVAASDINVSSDQGDAYKDVTIDASVMDLPDASQWPFTSSESTELALPRSSSRESAHRALVRTLSFRPARSPFCISSLACSRGQPPPLQRSPAETSGDGLVVAAAHASPSCDPHQLQKNGAGELNLDPEPARLMYGDTWAQGSSELCKLIRCRTRSCAGEPSVCRRAYLECVRLRAHRETDWSNTPLGPQAEWSVTLKTALSLCLTSSFPFVRALMFPECVASFVL
jgi:hypothetical protein